MEGEEHAGTSDCWRERSLALCIEITGFRSRSSKDVLYLSDGIGGAGDGIVHVMRDIK